MPDNVFAVDFDPHLNAPSDPDAGRRAARLAELGLGQHPDEELDAFAAKVADATGARYAMVNFLTDQVQYFSGLHTPSTVQAGAAAAAQASQFREPDRTMALDHGYCPHVVQRRNALVLDDVCDFPRFAGNPVVDRIGIRAYLGAPLINDGIVLGTVCAVDTEEHPWGRPGLITIKALATELTDLIGRRPRHHHRHRP